MKNFKTYFIENTEHKIFCDMDGVLCDFPASFELKYRKSLDQISAKYGDNFIWTLINRAGEPFWSEMPWMPDGKQLWEYIKQLNPTILSAPAKSPKCVSGKEKWIKRELGPNQRFIIDAEKDKYVTPGAILIDDMEKNINPWKAAGGIGILHTNTVNTIKELKKILDIQ